MASKELEVLEDYIVQNKLKITRQRRIVLNAFLGCEKHVSAEELYNQVAATDPKVGLATVYRTLALLTQSAIYSCQSYLGVCCGDLVIKFLGADMFFAPQKSIKDDASLTSYLQLILNDIIFKNF